MQYPIKKQREGEGGGRIFHKGHPSNDERLKVLMEERENVGRCLASNRQKSEECGAMRGLTHVPFRQQAGKLGQESSDRGRGCSERKRWPRDVS